MTFTEESLAAAERNIQMQIDELQKDMEAIQRLRTRYKIGDGPEAVAASTETKSDNGSYSTSWPWENKILFVLKSLQTGFVTDVAEKIHEIEPTITLDKATVNATFYLSKLYRDSKIGAEKFGKKNKYFSK